MVRHCLIKSEDLGKDFNLTTNGMKSLTLMTAARHSAPLGDKLQPLKLTELMCLLFFSPLHKTSRKQKNGEKRERVISDFEHHVLTSYWGWGNFIGLNLISIFE